MGRNGKEWERMKGRIKEEEGNKEKGKGDRRGWFDEECKEEKKKIEKRVEEVEEGEGDGKRYKEKKKEYRKICERKKTEENKKWMRKAQEARTEEQVWGILRLEKRKGRNWAWKE